MVCDFDSVLVRWCALILSSLPDQTTYLPEADRVSTSLKEYQAQIDVCMGGRVAEALSASLHDFFFLSWLIMVQYTVLTMSQAERARTYSRLRGRQRQW